METTFFSAVRLAGDFVRAKQSVESRIKDARWGERDRCDWLRQLLNEHEATLEARIPDKALRTMYISCLYAVMYGSVVGKERTSTEVIRFNGNRNPDLAREERRQHERRAGEAVRLLRQDGLIADIEIEEGEFLGGGPPYHDCIISITCCP